MEFITQSEVETEKIALNLAKKIKPGDILALFGNLGSGKTVFTKGLAKGLGIKKIITSPTFVLMKTYEIKKSQTCSLVHIDCYRMEDERDTEAIGLIEIIDNKNDILAIEWPERIESILPKETIKIKFKNLGADLRKITIK